MELELSKDVIKIVNECGFSIKVENQKTGNELFDNF